MLARTLTIALVAPLFAASLAAADPAAEKLFEDGRTALAASQRDPSQLDVACDAFRRSQALEPRVGTLLNLGDCEERRKRVAAAWEAFVEAKGLAERDRDVGRMKEADRRANALAPRLPYLLVAVTRTEGLEIQRDGVAVPEAAWDHEVPVDPKPFELSATAPHHAKWSRQVTIAEGQHLRVDVPALVAIADPVVIPPPDPGPHVPVAAVASSPEPAPSLAYRIGAGLLTGTDTDSDWINGVRIVANAAPLGAGWVRVVPSLMYAKSTDPADPYHELKTYAVGATLEYAYPVNRQLLAAGGLGFGADFVKDNYGNSSTNEWGCVRLSPTVVFGRFDVAIHYQLVRTSDRFVSLFEAGLDFFVW
ncbi:MAG TPA: hypothetical protein VIV58_38305 [Kofleriaceae bacterium]